VTINTNPKIFTLVQIAIHKTSGDCWTAINGKVYDVSNYGDKHPGGKENILKTCGVDGSQAYNKKHGGQSKPANVLDTMLIGSLSK
jgi:cytochrome b involved in lipid metabolism